jgi:signal transduction histidine kinase
MSPRLIASNNASVGGRSIADFSTGVTRSLSGCAPGSAGGGFGLVGMRERVQLAGGSLEVRSALGEGTTIVATLPARHRSGDAAGAQGRFSAAEGG